ITASSNTTNVGLSVRIVPRPAGLTRLPAKAPAAASANRNGANRANRIVNPPSRSANGVPGEAGLPAGGRGNPGAPAHGRAVFVGLAQVGVDRLGEPLWSGGGGGDRRSARGAGRGERRRKQSRQRCDEQADGDEFYLSGLDLLAEVLGRSSDHQAADEHGE